MDERIVNRVNELRYNSTDSIRQLAKSKLPHKVDLGLTQSYEYTFKGIKYKSPSLTSRIMFSDFLPFSPLLEKYHEDIFRESYKQAVENRRIYPILFFANGKFIKWSDIEIVCDYHFSYLIFNNIPELEFKIDTILIPNLCCKYTENVPYKKVPKDSVFIFDSGSDYYEPVAKIDRSYTTIEINNKEIYNFKNTIIAGKRFNIPTDYDVEVDSIFIFNKGLLENRELVKLPLNVFNTELSKEEYLSRASITRSISAFAFTNANKIMDMGNNIVNKEQAIVQLLNEEEPKFYHDISERFQFEFNEKLTSEENFKNALRYITDYDARMMNDIMRDKCRIIRKDYTGIQLQQFLKDDGFVHFSRNVDGDYNTYIIIFKNGYLYNGYQNTYYKGSEVRFRLYDYLPSDKFEIIFVTKVDNNVYKKRFWSNAEDDILLSPDIDLDNMLLASPTPHESFFDGLERNEDILYNVEFEGKRTSEDTADIKLKDSFYYDKLLFLGSKKQFVTYSLFVDKDIDSFELPTDFKMCGEINKYMVFINGKLIDPEEYNINTFNNIDPYYSMGIYFENIVIEKGDKIDVIYIGNTFKLVYSEMSGDTVKLDPNKLDFPFDKDLYFVFVNGRLCSRSEIKEINSNSFNLNIKFDESIKKVSVIQLVDKENILNDYFDKNVDLFTELCNKLSDEEFNLIFDNANINNMYEIDNSSIDKASVRLGLIKDYWMKSYIDNTEELSMSFGDKLDEHINKNINN